MRNFKRFTCTCVLLVLGASAVSGQAAVADEVDGSVLRALTTVTVGSDADNTRVLDDVAEVSASDEDSSAIVAEVQGGEVMIPTDASDAIELSLPNSDAGMSISLPFADDASAAEILNPGVVSFQNNNDTHTAAVVKQDGSVVIATVIDSSAAPTRFTYEVEGAPGSFLEAQPDGTVFLLDETRTSVLGGFMAAWARDAEGNDVPTRYEISGNELTQVVDLSSPTIAYPVVADPQAGYTLLEGVWKNRPGGYKYKTGNQWSTGLSAWGAAVWTSGLVGHQTVKTQGWVEWVNGPAPTTTTIHQQFDCHAVFGYAIWKAGWWWDFETARGSNPNWLTNPKDCNWP